MPTNRLLVPVANPETADRLLDTAITVARDRDLEVLVLHVVVVPMQLPLEQARRSLDVDESESVVEYAVEQARRAGVSAAGLVRFGRDVASGILHVAEANDVETILLGWRGRPRRRDVILGSYIDAVLANASCDVLVERIEREGGGVASSQPGETESTPPTTRVSSILVPIAGGPHTEYAAEIAGAIAREHGAGVELLTVVASAADEERVAEGRALLTRTSSSLGAVASVAETVRRDDDVVGTIADRSRDHDVTVVGAAEDGLIRRALVGSVPEAVARRADGTVVMAKRYRSAPTALWRRLRERLRR